LQAQSQQRETATTPDQQCTASRCTASGEQAQSKTSSS
jgi:hypothetical protein